MKNVGIRFVLAALCILALATVGVVLRADDDDEGTILRAKLTGFQEVPAKFTAGSGTFRATLSPDGTTLSYTLSWSNLTAAPLFAHIHFGQPGVNGAVMVFLCNDPNTPRTTPNCDGATVHGQRDDQGGRHRQTGSWRGPPRELTPGISRASSASSAGTLAT